MAIAYHNSAAAYASGFPSTPHTILSGFDAGSTADRTVVVLVFYAASIGPLTSLTCTYAGASPTGSGTPVTWSATNDKINVFWFEGAASGANDVVVSWVAGGGALSNMRVIAVAYNGAGAVSGVQSLVDATGDTTFVSPAISSATGSMVVALGTNSVAAERLTANTTEVIRYDADQGSLGCVAVEKAGAASVTITCNSDGSPIYEALFALSIAAASGGGGGSAIPVFANQYRQRRA